MAYASFINFAWQYGSEKEWGEGKGGSEEEGKRGRVEGGRKQGRDRGGGKKMNRYMHPHDGIW